MVLADVLMHAGIGTVFVCTDRCSRRLCIHRKARIALASAFILIEATVMTAVVG